MEAEKAGAGEEGERDEEEAGIAASRRCLARHRAQGDARGRRIEDEPEVRRMMLPVHVEPRCGEQQREPAERRGEEKRPEGHAAGGHYCASNGAA